jgi:hypothetical protein
MLYEVTGDILLTRAQAIAHGVAPNDRCLNVGRDWRNADFQLDDSGR